MYKNKYFWVTMETNIFLTELMTRDSNGKHETFHNWIYLCLHTKHCGLVVNVADYKHRGPGFDSRALLRIFLRELGLERGPLSLVIG
jgi:hypothetical protein